MLSLLAAVAAGCTSPVATVDPSDRVSPHPGGVLRYVALGDSYTIGTGVEPTERWPDQLVATLAAPMPVDPPLELVGNLGVNSFTSADLIRVELPRLDDLRPGFVSLLIGVNDVVQGVPASRFEANAARILDELVARVGADRVLVVTTPDYTVTPAGRQFGDPATMSAGIRRNNDILVEEAKARGIVVVDIFDISLDAAADPTLIAGDGLHPSGAQYARWVERIAPTVSGLLGDTR